MATERQGRILALFYSHRHKRNKPAPTLMEIARLVGATSRAGALSHVHALWRKGYLYRPEPCKERGYRLTKQGKEEAQKWLTPPK
jgi:SOS-response transcriptional repressor LexA